MAKYPCGKCKVGVKHKGILCYGKCQNWYHADCINLPYKEFSLLAKNKSTKWKCKNCESLSPKKPKDPIDNPSGTSNSSMPKEINLTSNDTMQELERSLVENAPESDEARLVMAGKLGTALSAENDQLKFENNQLKITLVSFEAEIEEYKTNEEKYMKQLEVLEQKIADMDLQQMKDKENRSKLQDFIEEHDKTQMKLLEDYEGKIRYQDQLILTLKRKIRQQTSEESHQNNEQNTTIAQETQTDCLDEQLNFQKVTKSISLDICSLKITNGGLENRLKELETKIGILSKDNGQMLVGNCKSDRHEKKSGHAAYAPKQDISKNPPATAKIRLAGETLEDFFENHIDFYKQLRNVNKTEQIAIEEANAFLEIAAEKTSRYKT